MLKPPADLACSFLFSSELGWPTDHLHRRFLTKRFVHHGMARLLQYYSCCSGSKCHVPMMAACTWCTQWKRQQHPCSFKPCKRQRCIQCGSCLEMTDQKLTPADCLSALLPDISLAIRVLIFQEDLCLLLADCLSALLPEGSLANWVLISQEDWCRRFVSPPSRWAASCSWALGWTQSAGGSLRSILGTAVPYALCLRAMAMQGV